MTLPEMSGYEILKPDNYKGNSMDKFVAFVDKMALWIADHPKTTLGVIVALAFLSVVF